MFKDPGARVPFAVIGIFLIIISVLASINLTRMDINMAKTMSSGLEISSADTAMQYARADIARAINYAGMEALKQLGKTPVISPDINSTYHAEDPEESSRKWAKAMIQNTLNQYIESNYMYDTFVNNGIAVNIDEAGDEIAIQTISMDLERSIEPPLFNPGKSRGYSTYWKISVPLTLHLKDLRTGTELMTRNETIQTVITSRYPLLKDLTDEYSERLNGTNAVMAETTAFSMAYTWGRGYLQYSKTTPLNIVDNRHLALIINGALLLDQGFVFNSVDAMSLVEYANQTSFTLSKKQKKYDDIVLEKGSLSIDPEQDSFESTDRRDEAEEEFEKAKRIDYNATPIADLINNKTLLEKSMASLKISEVTEKVYSAIMKTIVERSSDYRPGDHPDHPIDYRAGTWMHTGEPELLSTMGRDPGTLSPGVLYEEVWKVNWVRDHTWRKTWVESYPCGESICTVVKHHDIIVKDHETDIVTMKVFSAEDSSIVLDLKYRGTGDLRHNDLRDVYIEQNLSLDSLYHDPNLKDIVDRYMSLYFTNSTKRGIVLNFGLADPDHNTVLMHGKYEPWVREKAQSAVDEIRDMINDDVHLDPGINYSAYPVPSDLLEKAKDDLIMKVERNESRYVDKGKYLISDRYASAGAKVVSIVREWYVDEVKYQIREKFSAAGSGINDKIRDHFGDDAEKVKRANRDATKFLSDRMYLPLGLKMTAYHVDENGNAYPPEDLQAWNESVTLAINQEPNYLDAFKPHPSNPRLYTLKVRNINLLGETGLHVLPTLDPWIMTVNAWKIDVEGEFVKFVVYDADNEVHPNPIFGHDAQVYVRREESILDSLNNYRRIGDNLPIKFSFTTGTFIAVPPGKISGVGDKNSLDPVEESPGWKI